MTTGNETDPRDDALARAWRAQSREMPPPALDATILAAAHRAVGSGPRDAGQQAAEATRPQRWWMPLAAAATIGVVAIGILQIAPQAPVDIVVGERAEVASRVAPAAPAAPAKEMESGNVVGQAREAASPKSDGQARAVAPTPATPTPATSTSVTATPATPTPSTSTSATATPAAPSTAVPAAVTREKRAALDAAPAPPPPAATAAVADARKQIAAAPAMPAPEPFPADKLAAKVDAQPTMRQNERKDVAEAQSAPPSAPAQARAPAPAPAPAPATSPAPAPAPIPAPAPLTAPPPTAAPAPMVAQSPAPPAARAPATAMLAPTPLKKESAAGAAGSLAAADSAAKSAMAARERDTARDDASARNVPAAASTEQTRGAASPAELQARARDPDAWIARIRKLRDDGRVADAIAELRDFRRYVPDADARLPADLRQLLPRP